MFKHFILFQIDLSISIPVMIFAALIMILRDSNLTDNSVALDFKNFLKFN